MKAKEDLTGSNGNSHNKKENLHGSAIPELPQSKNPSEFDESLYCLPGVSNDFNNSSKPENQGKSRPKTVRALPTKFRSTGNY